jgi:hypothetical protein
MAGDNLACKVMAILLKGSQRIRQFEVNREDSSYDGLGAELIKGLVIT